MDGNIELRPVQLVRMNSETSLTILAVFAALALLVAYVTNSVDFPGFGLSSYLKFVWVNFLKPHEKTSDGQQSALESFYAAQVSYSAGDQASSHSHATGWHI